MGEGFRSINLIIDLSRLGEIESRHSIWELEFFSKCLTIIWRSICQHQWRSINFVCSIQGHPLPYPLAPTAIFAYAYRSIPLWQTNGTQPWFKQNFYLGIVKSWHVLGLPHDDLPDFGHFQGFLHPEFIQEAVIFLLWVELTTSLLMRVYWSGDRWWMANESTTEFHDWLLLET